MGQNQTAHGVSLNGGAKDFFPSRNGFRRVDARIDDIPRPIMTEQPDVDRHQPTTNRHTCPKQVIVHLNSRAIADEWGISCKWILENIFDRG